MHHIQRQFHVSIITELMSGIVVFLVALPLCLGIAQASGAPLISGLVAGIIGGLVVGLLSGSQASVSGPAAGLTAVVAAQLQNLGSFEALLAALVVAGLLQILLGLCRAGGMSAFVPSSVINGLLAAIGVILILKQAPHMVGLDSDPEGDFSFAQPDRENTFSELLRIVGNVHAGPVIVGLVSLAILIFWDRLSILKRSRIPAPCCVVVLGIFLEFLFRSFLPGIQIEASHLVSVPLSGSPMAFAKLLSTPDWTALKSTAILMPAITIAAVASLETLLNLEAVEQLDPLKRHASPNRELLAQGLGNMFSGLIGGLPMTSVIVRSSVNVNAGAKTRASAIFHGLLLLVCVIFCTPLLNHIPIASLAAILLVTGIRLASPALVVRMWSGGLSQFLPFVTTVVAIVFTDLIVGVLIGLGVSVAFILNNHLRQTIRPITEQHPGGKVIRLQFPEQLTFLNRAAIDSALRNLPDQSHVFLDASSTSYIDPDILGLIRSFRDDVASQRGIRLSLSGFPPDTSLEETIQFSDTTTREVQDQLTPSGVLKLLQQGNERFLTGRQLTRNLTRQLTEAASGQHPLAVVLSCIDSRSPAELIFDLGIGDVLNVRIAGNIISPKVLGSLEYGCKVAGARLIVVMGHTRCGAVTTAVQLAGAKESCIQLTGCEHLEPILADIRKNIDLPGLAEFHRLTADQQSDMIDRATRQNVERVVSSILSESEPLRTLVLEKRIAIAGSILNVSTGAVEFFVDATP